MKTDNNLPTALFQQWYDAVDSYLDVMAHDGWNIEWVYAGLRTIVKDTKLEAVNNNLLAQYIVELATQTLEEEQELVGPAFIIKHILELALANKIEGFGYYVRLTTTEGADYSRVVVIPGQRPVLEVPCRGEGQT